MLKLIAEELNTSLATHVGTGKNKRVATFADHKIALQAALSTAFVGPDNKPLPNAEDEMLAIIQKAVPTYTGTVEDFWANAVESTTVVPPVVNTDPVVIGASIRPADKVGFVVLEGKGDRKGTFSQFQIAKKENTITIQRLAKVTGIRLTSRKTSTDSRIAVLSYTVQGSDPSMKLEFAMNEAYSEKIPVVRVFGKDLFSKLPADGSELPLNVYCYLNGTEKIKGQTTIVSHAPESFVAAEKANITERAKAWYEGGQKEGVMLLDNVDLPFSYDSIGGLANETAKQAFDNWLASFFVKQNRMETETKFAQETELSNAEHRQNHGAVLKADSKLKAEIALEAIDAQLAAFNKLKAGGIDEATAKSIAFSTR